MTRTPTGHFLRLATTCIAACLLCFSLVFHTAAVQADEVVVIVNKDPVPPTSISQYVLAAIFGMRLTTWPDGSEIKVFVLPDDNPIHTSFCKQNLHIFPHQLRAAWDRLVYSGTGQSPQVLGSEPELKARIANTSGAIGYVTRKSLDNTIQILQVQ